MIHQLPQEVQSLIASYLSTPDLCFFAQTSKRSLQAALPLLKEHQQTLLRPPHWCMAEGSGHTAIGYTTLGLYACGNNNGGQLGLGDTNHRTTFTCVKDLSSEIKRLLALYQRIERLIVLGESHAQTSSQGIHKRKLSRS